MRDERRAARHERVPAGSGRDRLVQVDDVVAAARSSRRSVAAASGVLAMFDFAPLNDQPSVGPSETRYLRRAAGLPVEGRDHPRLMACGGQLGGQRLDVARHPTGVTPRIGGDERDPHHARG